MDNYQHEEDYCKANKLKGSILWIHYTVIGICSSVVASCCAGRFLPSKRIQRLQPLAAPGRQWQNVVSDWCSCDPRGAQFLHNEKTSALLHWRK